MANEFIELLNNAVAWNEWRRKHPNQAPSFKGVDFTNVDLHMSSLKNCVFEDCCFDGAKINFSN